MSDRLTALENELQGAAYYSTDEPRPVAERNRRVASPYPGLRPFHAEESRFFYGRDAQIEEVTRRLSSENCVAVLGGSGCGKSSIVRAGVIPALHLKCIRGRGDFWSIVTCTPGRSPIGNLVAAIDRILKPDAHGGRDSRIRDVIFGVDGLGGIVSEFRREIDLEEGLSEDVLDEANVLVLIDQFEELFRNENRDKPETAALVQLVVDFWRRRSAYPGLYFVLTMRTDDLHRCAEFIDLPEVINATGYLVRRLKEDEIREAIVAPCRPPLFRAGLLEGALPPTDIDIRPYDVELVTVLLDAVEELAFDPDHLPLLQHLLSVLWQTAVERWRREEDANSLTQARVTTDDLAEALGFANWDALANGHASGGMDPAHQGWLLRHCLEYVAETLFNRSDFGGQLTSPQQDLARTAFCLMGEVDDRGCFKRRWTSRAEIAAVAGGAMHEDDIEAVLRRFSHPYPLICGHGQSGDWDVAHEALMRNWPRLRAWLREDRDAGAAFQDLEASYRTWIAKAGRQLVSVAFLKGKKGVLKGERVERIAQVLTNHFRGFGKIQDRYNWQWAKRFAIKPIFYGAGNVDNENITPIEPAIFAEMMRFLKACIIRYKVVSGLPFFLTCAALIVSLVVVVQQNRLNAVQKQLAATLLWSGLRGWDPVPGDAYVQNLWQIVFNKKSVRLEFIRRLPEPDPIRVVGFRPQPILRAIGLRWPPEGRELIKDKIKQTVSNPPQDWGAFTFACAVAALREGLDEETWAAAREYFKRYLREPIGDLPWVRARVLACLGRDLGDPQLIDDAATRILDAISSQTSSASSFEMPFIVQAAAIIAWQMKADVTERSSEYMSTLLRARDDAIRRLRSLPQPQQAVILARSLVMLVAALPPDEQRKSLSALLAAVDEMTSGGSPENRLNVVLTLAQAFEIVAERHEADQSFGELQPLIEDAGRRLGAKEDLLARLTIARVAVPLLRKATGGTAERDFREALLSIAGIERTDHSQASAALVSALESQLQLAQTGRKPDRLTSCTVAPAPGGGPSDVSRPVQQEQRSPQAPPPQFLIPLLSPCIGLQGRLLALVADTDTLEVDRLLSAMEKPENARGPFAREGLARGLAALAPAMEDKQRERALSVVRNTLAITGSAEEAAAWAMAVSALLTKANDTAAVEQLIDVLKYPTAALTAREPNADQPRSATDILVAPIRSRLGQPTEPQRSENRTADGALRPGDLLKLLDAVRDKYSDIDQSAPPKRPGSVQNEPWY